MSSQKRTTETPAAPVIAEGGAGGDIRPAVASAAREQPSEDAARRSSGDHSALIALGAAMLAVVVIAAVAVVALVAMRSSSSNDEVAPKPADASESTTVSNSPGASSSPSASNDPLGVGMSLVNVACDSEYLVILDSTDVTAEYVTKLVAARNAATQARYLRTDRSCSGFNRTGPHGGAVYAAYLGPFPTVEDACAARASMSLPLAYVKLLSPTAKVRSLCACSTSVSALPKLSMEVDYSPTPSRGQAVADLQALLYRAGINKQMVIGGHFRESTQAWVVAYQTRAGLDVTGTADAQTWQSLKDDYC